MDNKNNEGFSYTYSAREQTEIRKIREKYTVRDEEDKMARLRRLDQSVTKKAMCVSLIVGILGALIMGIGMSLVMTELGAYWGLSHLTRLTVGIGVGLAGCLLSGLAYPIHRGLLRRLRNRIAPEILRLTEELMK